MNLHLNNKQLIMIIFPFIVATSVYFFKEEIIGGINDLFSNYDEYSNKELNQKIDIYLMIEEKYMLYKEIEDKIEQRKKNSEWVVRDVFYHKKEIIDVVSVEKSEQVTEKIVEKEYHYKLEALYPNDKVAIINGVIVREGSSIEDAKVVEIKDNSVLLKNKKGLKWLHLFQ